MSFLVSFGLTNFEIVFGLFTIDTYGYGPQQVGGLLTFIGIISAIVQGGLTDPFTRRWGDVVPASETSIDIMKSCGNRWGWARRLIDLGDALVGRKKPGDSERAREIYQQSLNMFTEMGAPGYIKVLQERLRDL